MTEQRSTAPKKEAGLMDYLSEAFLFRWNLLFLVGAAGAAALSPVPDVLLPLVGAAELAYLAGLASIPRFRAAVDAKVYSRQRAPARTPAVAAAQKTLENMLSGLDPAARERFLRLRARCLDMRQIAQGVRGEASSSGSHADEIRTPALDRLLWVFLRTLHSQQALNRFLDSTDRDQLEQTVASLTRSHEGAKDKGDERILRSLADSLATNRLRLDNYQKAERNSEFLTLELQRIESKIQALTEMMINHQDADFISSQVDSVAESMKHTEQAIQELNQITGLRDELEGTPPILESEIPERGLSRETN